MYIETHSAVSPQPQCLRKKLGSLKAGLVVNKACNSCLQNSTKIQLQFNFSLKGYIIFKTYLTHNST